MKKISFFLTIIILCTLVASCKSDSGGSTETVDEERPMTVAELCDFAKLFDAKEYRQLICEDSSTQSFSWFLKGIPELQKDICNPVTEKEQAVIDGLNWPKNPKYYWADENEVLDRWFSYVDQSSELPRMAFQDEVTYYSASEKRYYFWENTYARGFEIKQGFINGNYARVNTTWFTISLKYSDDSWKLVGYQKTDKQTSSICDKMDRLSGDELWDIFSSIDNTSEPYDGYKDENITSYIQNGKCSL